MPAASISSQSIIPTVPNTREIFSKILKSHLLFEVSLEVASQGRGHYFIFFI